MSSEFNRTFHNVLAITDLTKISVTDSSAISHPVTAGKRFVYFQNTGTGVVWFGGSTVDPANNRGGKLFPNDGFTFDRVEEGFKVFFKCPSGDSSTISVVEG